VETLPLANILTVPNVGAVPPDQAHCKEVVAMDAITQFFYSMSPAGAALDIWVYCHE
jgi:hypothetical protein